MGKLKGWVIGLIICVVVTIVVIKAVGGRHSACEGKPAGCLDGM